VAAKAAGYDVFVFDTDYDPDQLVMHLDHLREYRPDGLILLTTERNLAAVQRLEELNLPAVLLNWAMTGRRVGEVAVDYEPGLAELVAHLLELDHRRLAFVTGPPQFYSATARERAFRAVLAAQSPSLSEQAHFFPGEFRLTAQTGVAVIESLRQIPPAERPTAVVASNDLMAISILRALAAEGWTVPETISVAGIDDISLAAYTTPALTTLRLPRQEMTRLAFRALKEMIEAPHLEASAQSVTPRLIVRHSVGPAARVSKNS
jgi:LacI family transcriptional regulator